MRRIQPRPNAYVSRARRRFGSMAAMWTRRTLIPATLRRATGAARNPRSGRLPIMAEVYEEAARRNVEIFALPTESACRLLADLEPGQVNAVLHVTCYASR